MARPAFLVISLILFFQMYDSNSLAQSTSGGDRISSVTVERNLRAIKTYYSDATAVFEGFMLCQKFSEKQKLLTDLAALVKQIDTKDVNNLAEDEMALWRAKSHFLYGIALGMVGDKKLADFETSQGNTPLFAENQSTFKDEELRIGDKNLKLAELKRIQQEILRELAIVQVSINPQKRESIGIDLKLRAVSTAKVLHAENIPFILANSEARLKGLLLKEGQREFIYLPAGKYEISKAGDATRLAQFEIKDISQNYAVTVPSNSFPAKYLYIGLGLVALGVLGFIIF